jgi:hypothetical protein
MRTNKASMLKAISLVRLPARSLWKAVIILCSLIFFQGCKKEMNPSKSREMSQEKERSLNMTANLKSVDLKLIASDFVSPIEVVAVPDASGRLAVIDQVGKIWMIDNAGNKMTTPFLDIISKMITLRQGYDERGS